MSTRQLYKMDSHRRTSPRCFRWFSCPCSRSGSLELLLALKLSVLPLWLRGTEATDSASSKEDYGVLSRPLRRDPLGPADDWAFATS